MKYALYGLGAGFFSGVLIEILEAITPLDLGADVPAWPFWMGVVGLLAGISFAFAFKRRA